MTSLTIDKIKDSLLNNISSLRQFNINSTTVVIDKETSDTNEHNSKANPKLTIPPSLRKQTEMLDKLANSKTLNNSYTLEIKPLSMRSEEETRFISLLSHFIKRSKENNQAIYSNLKIEYKNDDSKSWNKALVNEEGCSLSGKNPYNFYRFISSIHKASQGNKVTELNYGPEQLKGFTPIRDMKITDEANELYLNLHIPNTIDIQGDISNENLLDLIELINIQAELLKIKENSIKFRQDNLISLYNGNPNSTVKEMILGTNAINIELRKEQMDLVTLCAHIGDILEISPVKGADIQLSKAVNSTNEFTLINDNDLSFIITTDSLDSKQIKADANLSPSPYKT